MPTTFIVPNGIAYVGGALLSTVYLSVWQMMLVGKARSASGVKYPQLYAEKSQQDADRKALIFNCTQRAHQNTLESLPSIILVTVISGVRYPIPAATFCAMWTFGRVFYTLGYITGEPAKRNSALGSFGYIPIVGLLGLSGWVVVNSIMAGL